MLQYNFELKPDASRFLLRTKSSKTCNLRLTAFASRRCKKPSIAEARIFFHLRHKRRWFQNRRARHKNKHLEEEYLKLKSAHDAIDVEKCDLENEVLKLKKKHSGAEESTRKLSGAVNGASGCGGGDGGGGESGGSFTSSFSIVTYHPLVGEFGVDGEVDLMYIPDYNFNNCMDWGNLYGIL